MYPWLPQSLRASAGVPYVCADEEQAGRTAAEYLISKGVQEPAVCGGSSPNVSPTRYRGRQFSGDSQGKADSGPGQTGCNLVFRTSFERGYNHFKHFLQSGLAMPDGIVAASDATANGIVKACRENGIRIPEGFFHSLGLTT